MPSLQLGRRPRRPDYVYVASSWRNPLQIAVCAALRSAGIDHYDFRNPTTDSVGFSWRETKSVAAPASVPGKGTAWESTENYVEMIQHPRAVAGFDTDFDAMNRADTFVMALPCGKSAHLELGWAIGAGRRTVILMENPIEPELMYRGVDYLTDSFLDLLGWLGVED